ncbi:MAG: outer membrane beta-barrel protein [Bacteroidia bacterium]|nr:outer membrane beta-barrel protein [Bacteroidia bacterium]
MRRYPALIAFLLLYALHMPAQKGPEDPASFYQRLSVQMSGLLEQGAYFEVLSLAQQHLMDPDLYRKWGQEPLIFQRGFQKVSNDIRRQLLYTVALAHLALSDPAAARPFLKRYLSLSNGVSLADEWLAVRRAAREEFFVSPKWTAGLYLLPSGSLTQVTETYTLFQQLDASSTEKNYDGWKTRLGLGISAEYFLKPRISLIVSPFYSNLGISYRDSLRWQLRGQPGINQTLAFSHTYELTYASLPVMARVSLASLDPDHRISYPVPYLQAGGWGSILLGATQQTDTEIFINSSSSPVSSTRAIFGRRSAFLDYQAGLSIGAGVYYELGATLLSARLFVEAGLHYSLRTVNDRSERFAQQNVVHGVYEVQDDVRLHQVLIKAGIAFPLSYTAFNRIK